MILHTLPRSLRGLLLVLLCLAGCATPVVVQPESETNPAETAFQRGTAALQHGDRAQQLQRVRFGMKGFSRLKTSHCEPMANIRGDRLARSPMNRKRAQE